MKYTAFVVTLAALALFALSQAPGAEAYKYYHGTYPYGTYY